jgi:hypothetical protein
VDIIGEPRELATELMSSKQQAEEEELARANGLQVAMMSFFIIWNSSSVRTPLLCSLPICCRCDR